MDGNLPTYEESTTGDSFEFQSDGKNNDRRPPPEKGGLNGQRILDNLTISRATHIRAIVDELVYPILEKQSFYGISETTIALMPSNIVSSETETSENVDVVADGEIHEVKLEGHMNRVEFWRQPDVITELRGVLQDRLSASLTMPEEPPIPIQPAKPVQKAQRKGFFGRSSSSAASPVPAIPMTAKRGGAQVKVDLEDICIRTISDFGLFETLNRPAVLIRYNARC
ncbi:hypothetical protein K402DRAFT_394363 [Aulographum hederae CBS 113979]|uniref:Uncharacterized protein n=1 Tax=Aulographum hederae CBS 113979 TaxID=1176131 RepID=A0A6G1GY65_9PEZI|nr:hypothetical protein K402DRAFT_394363 [Aulographum hederae CBS 113979]